MLAVLHLVGWITCGATAAVVAAGCGSSASPAERQARCFDAHRADAADAPIAVSGAAWHATLRRICREAAREGQLGASGQLSKGDVKRIIRRHPRIDYPICEERLIRERDEQMTPTEAKHLPTTRLRAIGRRYCDVVIGSGLATDADGLSVADRDSLGRRHPELLTPFCLAGAEAAYDTEKRHVFTHADLRKLMTLVCTESARRGYIRLGGATDDAAVAALSKRETIRMIRQGRVHPLQ